MNIYDIEGPQSIKSLSIHELEELAKEIRSFLIHNVAHTGGHLSSNLGIVETTIALHYVFNSPEDKILFDVGHQSYVHKILTGRASKFSTLRQYKGLSGFQKRHESIHDPWEAGHSSTSLSAALGIAVARDLDHKNFQVIPVIGDGAMGGGMALEALNQIGSERRKMVIIFNDNNMSISKNVGAMNDTFTKLRMSRPYNNIKKDLKGALGTSKIGSSVLESMRNMKDAVKDNVVNTSIFGEFNLDYIGPIDGHDFKSLIRVLKLAKNHNGPIVVHITTKKGKGYPFAEADQEGKWHGVGQFDPKTGKSLVQMSDGYLSWSEIISSSLMRLAKENNEIVAITPAMISGSKLAKFFETYPDRSFDCGIAEEHAMTFAAGMASCGKRPFISVYSSFLQRAYDQINHDVTRMNLPVVIGIDRCGLVGEDGATHHGVFDISILRSLPNIVLSQPKDAIEAQNLLYTAFAQNESAFAIRYPRGSVPYQPVESFEMIPIGSWTREKIKENTKAIVITYGPDVDKVISKARVNDLAIEVVNARFFKPIDEEMLCALLDEKLPIFVYETDMLAGGLSSAILEYCNDNGLNSHFIRFGIDDRYIEQGSLPQLRKSVHIDLNSLFDAIAAVTYE